MRAISLWQPWATAIAVGAKRIETRDWATSYRGPLAIHAARRLVRSELLMHRSMPTWRAALNFPPNVMLEGWLPFGSIVATARLVDCVLTQKVSSEILDAQRSRPGGYYPDWHWVERDMGNYTPGRWAWILEDVRPIEIPIPHVGRQGFFEALDHYFEKGGLVLQA